MSLPGLSGNELIAWVDQTSAHWRELFARHPEALLMPCTIRETSNVAQLLQHIVAVELRFAQRLAGVGETRYEDLPAESAEMLYAVHAQAIAHLQQLQSHGDTWWSESIEFTTRSAGTLRAPRRVVLVHLLMHSIRHYAQLATLVRQHGIACDWWMDYLGMTPKQ